MKSKKITGSFYTPKVISDFLIDYLYLKLGQKKNLILEPSAGDGAFIHSIYNHKQFLKKLSKVVAIEREPTEAQKIRNISNEKSLEILHTDFLFYQLNNKQKFDLVIGNPPYIKKNHLDAYQIELCAGIHRLYPSLSKNKIKNIWTAFLVRSINFLNDAGVLAFVLPSDLLQVKFASELRSLIMGEFERVEIFSFNDLLFKESKGQDTLILIAERKSEIKGVFYTHINDLSELKSRNFSLNENILIKESKWNHHHLQPDELELLDKLKNKINQVNHYCTTKPGIVTAANDYFIVNDQTVHEYSLKKYVKPIIQRGMFLNGNAVLTEEDFQKLIESHKPAYLIALDKDSKIRHNQKINQYLNIGIERGINKRYKMTLRKNWFQIPNIGVPAEGLFFKRCNEYPKIIKNKAKVLATDNAYLISMKNGYNLNSLIFSFYNSLTLSFAELEGRFYGGGVLELTPNEFKNLPIPYFEISESEFDSFAENFEKKNSIKDICNKNDDLILRSIDKNIDYETIKKLSKIREKLFLKRIREI